MPTLHLKGRIEPVEIIDEIELTDLSAITGVATGTAVFPGGHTAAYELTMQREQYNASLYADPTPETVEALRGDLGWARVPLPDWLAKYDGFPLMVNDVAVPATMRMGFGPARGVQVGPDEWSYFENCNVEYLQCDVPDSDGDLVMQSLGSWSRGEISMLQDLAGAEDWDKHKAWLDYVHGGRQGAMP